VSSVTGEGVAALLDRIGAQRLVFGTGIPLKIPGPAKLKLELLDVAPEVKAQLAAGNMERLLECPPKSRAGEI